ncbi:hypothetical protein INS49_006054 [Diaporthe citri]|uniref:uncharacterized protein n=1 Tax=Diaporthe citri TaxID=83186 RepID=UPI001C7F1150|nr:uncharacterized protein INS49_006054 [Diaporthe citri]KAG6364453.1 hypothetical protein INS49_006054 [Diaporthe citri]
MDGYVKVAHLMSKYEEFAILKRFKALNYPSLLYRQAEITYLQEDLEKLAERDATEPARQYYTKDWWALAHTATEQEGGEQWRKVQQIREKLDDYNDQLVKLATLAKLDAPASPDDPESPELGDSIYHYKKSLLFGAADIFTTVVASLLPMLSIIVLFFVSSNALKLIIITLFSAPFSLALALMTTARRIEIFAATAA